MNNEQSLFYALADISAATRAMNKEVFVSNKEIRSPEMYRLAMLLYGAVGQFIDELEDRDENMNPETMKLPDMDEVFKDNPVTDYVSSIIDLAAGTGKAEHVQAAAKKLADFQNEVYSEIESVEVKKEVTLADFIDHIVEDQNLISDDYAESFKGELTEAIKILKDRPGYCTFIIVTKERGTLQGKLNATAENVTILIDEKKYDFVAYKEEQNKEEEEYDGFCCEYPEAEEEEEVTLLEYVEATDSAHAEEVNANMDFIDEYLKNVAIFTDEDVKLIRYYLSHLPQHSHYEVEKMEDNTAKVAYRQYHFMRNIK